MPAAVIITLIANEYEAEPQLVTGTVVAFDVAQPDHVEHHHRAAANTSQVDDYAPHVLVS